MMYISDKYYGDLMEWHVGETLPKFRLNAATLATVDLVQADGDELDAIVDQFRSLPLAPHARIQVWRGSLAQFIADNLLNIRDYGK